MTKKVNKSGFSLIEVVLTIAIGALIFLLAFIAFRNAQVNRRDSQRRSDLDKISAELNNYASDNSGAYPTSANYSTFLTNYLSGLKDPTTGNAYGASFSATPATGETSYTYWATAQTGSPTASNTFCDGTTLATAKSYKVQLKLEKGTACRDSSSN